MPWNGLGTYILPPAFTPEVNGTTIDATRYNGATSDIAAGITNAFAKDGQNVPTANLSMGSFKLTNLAAGSLSGDAVAFGQAAVTFGTVTAAITGHASLDVPLAGNVTMTGPLGINLGAASAVSGFQVLSGGAGNFIGMSLGRTGVESGWGVAAANNNFLNGTVAGDTAHYSTGTMWLGVGTNPAIKLDSSNNLLAQNLLGVTGGARVQGNTVFGSGSGLEMLWDGTNAIVQGFNRTGAVYSPMVMAGSTLAWAIGASTKASMGSSGELILQNNTGEMFRMTTTTARGSGAAYLAFYDPTGAKGYYGYTGANDDLNIYNILNGNINFITNSSQRGLWDTSGRLIIGSATGASASGLEVHTAQNAIVIRQDSSGTYTGLRIYNDINSGSRAVEMDYSGSAFAGVMVTSGPSGEQGIIGTTGAFPFTLYTNNTARLSFSSSGTMNFVTGSRSFQIGGATTSSESAEQAAGTGGFSSIVAHGGPRKPDVVYAVLRCKTAELNYSIGDEVQIGASGSNNANYFASATQVGLIYQTAGAMVIVNKTTFTLSGITAANWKIVFYCIWL